MKKIQGFTHDKAGFTLIELLVVIAIIGVLASVILVALSSARDRGIDAKVKSTFNSLHTQSELYYSDNRESYSGICKDGIETSTGVKSIYGMIFNVAKEFSLTKVAVNDTGTLTTATCNENNNAWAAEAPLKNTNGGATNMFCADSTGFVGAVAGTIGSGVVCSSTVPPAQGGTPPVDCSGQPGTHDDGNGNCVPDVPPAPVL